MKIPWYIPKWAEEAARAGVVAAGTYIAMSVQANGVPTTQQGIVALLAGAVPVLWAAVRAALNNTPLTPPNAGDTPLVLPPSTASAK